MSPAGTSLRGRGRPDPRNQEEKREKNSTQPVTVLDIEYNIESEMREAQSAKILETVGNGDVKRKTSEILVENVVSSSRSSLK
jgi:hypothetical protein